MFGYVRAVQDILTPEQAKRYEGVYCGMCRTLGSRYGWTARLILNYDFVFLALLLSEPETDQNFPTCPCPIHPWKSKACCPHNTAMDVAADESLILTWWKLQDAIADGGFWERLGSRLAALFLRGHYRRAAALRPEFDQTVQTCLEELHEMERANLASLDRPADTFARILQDAATQQPLAARQSAVRQILYHVGRWIYLVDAWDDLDQDKKSGSYNPLLARYGADAKTQEQSLRETLHVSLGLADTAFSLLDWGAWEDLLGHILGTGLPAVEEAVFTGQWRSKRRKRRK